MLEIRILVCSKLFYYRNENGRKNQERVGKCGKSMIEYALTRVYEDVYMIESRLTEEKMDFKESKDSTNHFFRSIGFIRSFGCFPS